MKVFPIPLPFTSSSTSGAPGDASDSDEDDLPRYYPDAPKNWAEWYRKLNEGQEPVMTAEQREEMKKHLLEGGPAAISAIFDKALARYPWLHKLKRGHVFEPIDGEEDHEEETSDEKTDTDDGSDEEATTSVQATRAMSGASASEKSTVTVEGSGVTLDDETDKENEMSEVATCSRRSCESQPEAEAMPSDNCSEIETREGSGVGGKSSKQMQNEVTDADDDDGIDEEAPLPPRAPPMRYIVDDDSCNDSESEISSVKESDVRNSGKETAKTNEMDGKATSSRRSCESQPQARGNGNGSEMKTGEGSGVGGKSLKHNNMQNEETDSDDVVIVVGEETDSDDVAEEETDSDDVADEETDSDDVADKETDSDDVADKETDSDDVADEETDSDDGVDKEAPRAPPRRCIVDDDSGSDGDSEISTVEESDVRSSGKETAKNNEVGVKATTSRHMMRNEESSSSEDESDDGDEVDEEATSSQRWGSLVQMMVNENGSEMVTGEGSGGGGASLKQIPNAEAVPLPKEPELIDISEDPICEDQPQAMPSDNCSEIETREGSGVGGKSFEQMRNEATDSDDGIDEEAPPAPRAPPMRYIVFDGSDSDSEPEINTVEETEVHSSGKETAKNNEMGGKATSSRRSCDSQLQGMANDNRPEMETVEEVIHIIESLNLMKIEESSRSGDELDDEVDEEATSSQRWRSQVQVMVNENGSEIGTGEESGVGGASPKQMPGNDGVEEAATFQPAQEPEPEVIELSDAEEIEVIDIDSDVEITHECIDLTS